MKQFLLSCLLLVPVCLLAQPEESSTESALLDRYAREGRVSSNYSKVLGATSNLVMSEIFNDQTLAEFLFNQVASHQQNFSLNETGIGDKGNLSVGIGLQVQRGVVQNKDVFNSYSVLDRVRLDIGPKISASYSGVTAEANLSVGVEVRNVRIVKAKQNTQILPVNEIKNILNAAFVSERMRPKSAKQKEEENEKYANFMPLPPKQTSARDAYLGKLWNPITMVLRLPLHYKRAMAMDDWEILSYSLHGGVSMGLGFGASAIPVADILKFGVQASLFVKGAHRITVMKEKPKRKGDNFVRVMLTRELDKGGSISAGSLENILEGVLSIDNFAGNFAWGIVKGILNPIPYRITVTGSHRNFYDVVYRYNLNDKAGQKAYNYAALGMFKESEKVALDKQLKPRMENNLSVQRLFLRKGVGTQRSLDRLVNLFVTSWENKQNLTSSVSNETDEEGRENKIFRSKFESSKWANYLFAYREGREHSFDLKIDKNKFFKTSPAERTGKSLWKRAKYFDYPPDTMRLYVTLHLSDSHTSVKEYIRYVKEVEKALDRPGLFPIPPKKAKNSRFEYLVANLGPTDFSLVFKLSFPQLFKFANYPKNKMWPALIKAFNAKNKGWDKPETRTGLYLSRAAVYGLTLPASALGIKLTSKDDIIVAKLKERAWIKMQNAQAKGLKEFSEAVGEFFKSGDYGPELMHLLRIVLHGDKIPFEGSAKAELITENTTFQSDNHVMFKDPSLSKFESLVTRYRENIIDNTGVAVSNVLARILGKTYFRLSFVLEEVPKTVFFNLYKSDFLGVLTNSSVKSLVVKNNGQFKKGINVIQVRLNDQNHFLYPLYSKLKPTKNFMFNKFIINVAGSSNGKDYGLVGSSRFSTFIRLDQIDLNAFNKSTIQEEQICRGRFASELILWLQDRPLRVCPNSERNEEGFCKEGKGMIPYKWFSNKPLHENLKERNEWIKNNCPIMTQKDKIDRMLSRTAMCGSNIGKNVVEKLNRKQPFFICPPDDPRDSNGFCLDGFIPYKYYDEGFEKDNLRLRNEFIMRFCPFNQADLLKQIHLDFLLRKNSDKSNFENYIKLLKVPKGKDYKKGMFQHIQTKRNANLLNFYPDSTGLIVIDDANKKYYLPLIINVLHKDGRAVGYIDLSSLKNTPWAEQFRFLNRLEIKIRNENGKIIIQNTSNSINFNFEP